MSMSYIGIDLNDEALGSIYVKPMRSIPQKKFRALKELVGGSPPRPDTYGNQAATMQTRRLCVTRLHF
jgi:hypothetical protein